MKRFLVTAWLLASLYSSARAEEPAVPEESPVPAAATAAMRSLIGRSRFLTYHSTLRFPLTEKKALANADGNFVLKDAAVVAANSTLRKGRAYFAEGGDIWIGFWDEHKHLIGLGFFYSHADNGLPGWWQARFVHLQKKTGTWIDVGIQEFCAEQKGALRVVIARGTSLDDFLEKSFQKERSRSH